MQHTMKSSCWTAALVLCCILTTVCAKDWEVINDEAADDFFAEEVYIPVGSSGGVDPKHRTDTTNEPSLPDSQPHKNSEYGLEVPTLVGSQDNTARNSDSEVTTFADVGHVTEAHTDEPQAAGQDLDQRQEEISVPSVVGEGEELEDDFEGENLNTVSSSVKPDIGSTTSSESQRLQKKTAGDDDSKATPTPQQKHTSENMRFRSEKVKALNIKRAEELGLDLSLDLHLEPNGVEEIFLPGSEPMRSRDVDCPPDSNSWECLMMADDLLMSKDRNLSGATAAHRRVKRQSDNGNTDNDDDVQASGDGNDLYPTFDETSTNLELANSYTFDNNASEPFNEAAFKEKLKKELERLYKDVPGFGTVVIDKVTLNPDGTVDTDVKININTGGAEFSQLTNDEYLDQLEGNLRTVSASVLDDLQISGRKIVGQTPATDLRSQASSILADPCATHVCPLGFHQCSVVGDTRSVRCEHKCQTFESARNCEHGATCELDGDYEPYCACTKRWAGTYCELPVKDNKLDEGEIAGVALGAGALTVGLVGTCCYLLICRRRNKDIVFSNYSDEEGSDRMSNPSSKLSNFVIDRPRITIAPISTFNPSNSLSGLSSSGNSGPHRYSSA